MMVDRIVELEQRIRDLEFALRKFTQTEHRHIHGELCMGGYCVYCSGSDERSDEADRYEPTGHTRDCPYTIARILGI